MQARLRAAVFEVLARNQRDHVKIGGNGGRLGGVVTEEGVRTFVRKSQVDQVCLLTLWVFSSRARKSKIISRWGRFVVPKLCKNPLSETESES